MILAVGKKIEKKLRKKKLKKKFGHFFITDRQNLPIIYRYTILGTKVVQKQTITLNNTTQILHDDDIEWYFIVLPYNLASHPLAKTVIFLLAVGNKMDKEITAVSEQTKSLCTNIKKGFSVCCSKTLKKTNGEKTIPTSRISLLIPKK